MSARSEQALAVLIREKREALGFTLDQTVARCERKHRPSRAYVAKLETGAVQSPSPFILHELSHALSIPYPTIMEAAGYVFPQGHEPPRPGLVVDALLAGDDLTAAEHERLAKLFIRIARAIREDETDG